MLCVNPQSLIIWEKVSSALGHDSVTKAQASIYHAEVFVYFRHAVSVPIQPLAAGT